MEAAIKKTVEVLTGLLEINIARVEGYQKAAQEAPEPELKIVLKSMADESKKNASELAREIKKSGGDPREVYPAGRDEKTIPISRERHSIRDACEYGKDAQSAYRDAISSNELTPVTRQLVRNQEVGLKASNDIIRNFKEGHHVTHPITF